GAAPGPGRAAGLDAVGDAQGLLFAFDAAGAGHDGDLLLAADLDAAAVDDRIGRVEQAVGPLVGGRHAGDVVHPGVGQDAALVQLGGVAHQAKDVVVGARDQGDRQALLFKLVDDLVQFFLGGAFFGGDNHGCRFLSVLNIALYTHCANSSSSACRARPSACSGLPSLGTTA